MIVKICGITKEMEIDALNKLQPEYIGFVFAESKRKVTIEVALKFHDKINKNIKTVGVFRNNSKDEILNILKYIPLDVVQLHGNENEDFIKYIRDKSGKEVWKAFSINTKEDLNIALNSSVDTILLDGINPGSGETFSWDILKNLIVNKKIILAGGINEDNVSKAIEIVNPWGVDVSTGVENIDVHGNRYKDENKMKNFICKVR